MKNSRKDFDIELSDAFRRAAELEFDDDVSPEEANRMFPRPVEFKELLSRYEEKQNEKKNEKQKEEITSSNTPKWSRFMGRLGYVAAVLAILIAIPFFLMGAKYQKSTSAHGYTVNKHLEGYEYFKVQGYPFYTDEEYESYQAIGPIHRKYVPTYIPEGCSYTSYNYNPSFNYQASYSFYDIDEETGEYGDAVNVIIFASKTHTAGTGKKTAKHPEIIELPNGDYGVIVKDKKTDMVTELFWANDEISIRVLSYTLPFEELVKIFEGIKYTTEFTE